MTRKELADWMVYSISMASQHPAFNEDSTAYDMVLIEAIRDSTMVLIDKVLAAENIS